MFKRHIGMAVLLTLGMMFSLFGEISIKRAVKYQTMEGFGFFGGRGPWWDSNDPSYFFSNAWLDLMFTNLGATMWRNELFPHVPVTGNSGSQNATWSKQRPCAQAIDAYCRERGIDTERPPTASRRVQEKD